MESIRLDLLVTEKGIARSREAAKRLIEEGKVTVDGKTVNKPSKLVSPSSIIDAQEEKGKLEKSDFVIKNNSDLENLKTQVEDIISILVR